GVVPAGVKSKAGTKAVLFLQATPETELSEPPPKLTKKQTEALDKLRQLNQPLEPRQLARLAKCGSQVVQSLVQKGLARKSIRRQESVEPLGERETQAIPESSDNSAGQPLELNGD